MTTAHVNYLAARRSSRIIAAFFDVAESLKGRIS